MKMLKAILLLGLSGCLQPNPKTVEREVPVFIEPDQPAPPVVQPPIPGFITVSSSEDVMLLDAQTLSSDNKRLDTFYVYACDLYNAGRDMKLVEEAANKLINSVSTATTIERLTSIGPADCIFRADQTDYNISSEKYRALEKALLLDFVPQSIRAQNLQFLLQKRKPYLILSDMAVTLTQGDQLTNSDTNGDGLVDTGCGIYCLFTETSIYLDEFFDDLGINFQREFDDEAAWCAATNRSPIALGKGRVVCIVETADGYLSTSWDSSQANQQSINLTPFPREVTLAGGVLQSLRQFEEDAQEHLATLPNGLYVRRLNGADGLAQSEAPGNVVVDPDDRFHGGIIRLGSCSQCHATIGKALTDEAGDIIRQNPAFDANEKLLGLVFFDQVAFDAKMGEMNAQHDRALTEAGVTSRTVDPITVALMQWIREPYDLTKAASFTGLDEQTFLEQLRGTEVSSVVLASLFSGATVSFADYQGNFETLVEELNLFRDADLNASGGY